MSSPRDNSTTSEQTQDALAHHINYHKGCNAWEAWYNASLTSTSSSSATPTSTSIIQTPTADTSSHSSINVGPIFLIYRNMQNKHQQVIEGTTGRLSVFSGGGGYHNETDPSKFEVGTTPMVGPSGGPGSGGVTPGVSASPPPPANHGTGSATGSHTPPPFNPYVIPTLAPRMMSMNPDVDQQTD
ncbi:hypothetical protein FRB96_005429, partial [Tulasnella sp. 330]